jgi:hypothetical protein
MEWYYIVLIVVGTELVYLAAVYGATRLIRKRYQSFSDRLESLEWRFSDRTPRLDKLEEFVKAQRQFNVEHFEAMAVQRWVPLSVRLAYSRCCGSVSPALSKSSKAKAKKS